MFYHPSKGTDELSAEELYETGQPVLSELPQWLTLRLVEFLSWLS